MFPVVNIKIINDYLKYLQVEKQYSNLTISHYKQDLMVFFGFCNDRSISHWHLVKPEQIKSLIMEIVQLGSGHSRIARLLAAIRGFYRYLNKCDINFEFSPAEGVRPPKSEKKLPNVPDVDQTQAMLNQVVTKEIDIRDLAICELFYATGLRLFELVSVNLEDIDWKQKHLHVIGKGNRERYVPIGGCAIKALKAWLEVRNAWISAGKFANDQEDFISVNRGALFTSQRGGRITTRSVQKRLSLWGKKYSQVKLHPHLFRHAFASHILESSHNLRAVQHLLGHQDIGSTQIYTHLDFQQLAEQYDQAHPRAKKKK
jgi:integrase/recombinase XerC